MIASMIENNIPIPKKVVKTKNDPTKEKYEFGKMKVGESQLFKPSENECSKKLFQKISKATYRYAEKYSMKFMLRNVKDGVRVWRII